MLRFFHLKKSTMDFKSSLKMLQPILKFWKTFVVICGPLCTLPLVLGNPTDQDGKDITKVRQSISFTLKICEETYQVESMPQKIMF